MKKNIYAIRDVKSGFLSPIVDDTDQQAVRNFSFSCSKSDTLLNFAPEDYSLYFLGTFDTESGKISSSNLPELVIQASDLVSHD